jgi:beta-mannosidase
MRLIRQIYNISALFLIIISFSACSVSEKTTKKQPFTSGWEFYYDSVWYPATVPGFIHTDLLNNNIIKDPFFRTNEDSVQWISYRSWEYRTGFDKKEVLHYANAEIVFEGLDTYAEVFLNGKKLIHQGGTNHTDNMFRKWVFPLPEEILLEKNELTVRFFPSILIEQSKSEALPYPIPDTRALSRKAPYQSGWDWGPKLITCGIWKEAYLRLWNDFKIDNFQVFQKELSDNLALLNLKIEIDACKKCQANINCLIDGKINKTLKNINLKKGKNLIECDIKIKNPERWWPNGLGKQKLYRIKASINNGNSLDSAAHNIGLRDVKIIMDKDSTGSKFEFHVNGVPVFMKGANWIPGESFPTRMSPEKYEFLLLSCRDANMNMLRVWGGGIYEDDLFYDICDKMGILIWQDFIYAGALYPIDKSFEENIVSETAEQIKRMRNHPCLALWCGNNEVKNGWEDWGWQDNYSTEQKSAVEKDMKLLFETLLPQAVCQYDSGRTYIATSPLWGWGHPECITQGDSHYWGVWWGEEPFEVWEAKTGRFMSEYGFQSYPELSAIKKFALPEDLSIESAVLKNHQKHSRGVEIITKSMNQYFGKADNFEDFVYLSQLVQAYGIGNAIEVHRRQMPYCMGSLYWQLNDCWPVASWSSIDYFGNLKALHYTVRNEFAQIIISTETIKNGEIPIYIVSDSLKDISGKVEIKLIDFRGAILYREILNPVTAKANASTLIAYSKIPEKFLKKTNDKVLVISFFSTKDKLFARKIHYFEYPVKLNLSRPNISIHTNRKDNQYILTLKSDFLAKGVYLSTTTGISGKYSDNYFDLLPNEEKEVIFEPNSGNNEIISFTVRSYRYK